MQCDARDVILPYGKCIVNYTAPPRFPASGRKYVVYLGCACNTLCCALFFYLVNYIGAAGAVAMAAALEKNSTLTSLDLSSESGY